MIHPQRRTPIPLLIALLLLLGATAQAQDATPTDLDGTTWVLRAIDTDRPPLPVLPVLLTFAAGELSGSAGCNDYRADVADLEDGALEVASVYATRRVCEPLVLAQEDAYLAKLQGATALRLDGGDLVVDYWLGWVDGRYGAMRFARHAPPERLTATPWRWVRYEDPMVGGVDLADPEAFRLTFTDRGRLLLDTDCLEAALPYALDGSNVAINTRGLDLSACDGASPTWRLVGDLEATRIVAFREGRLLLDLFVDSGTLLFEPAP